jgi:uncharacterized protein YjdB
MKAGESSEALIVTFNPDNAYKKTVVFSSSNTSVATVGSGGAVKAKNPGTATITAKASDGGAVATCKVTVTGSNITLNTETLSLDVGGTSQLSVKFDPEGTVNKAISWSSSYSSVVSVSAGGLVTAKSPGTAIITAKATESGNAVATCIVSVKAPHIVLDYDTVSMRVGDIKIIKASFSSTAPTNTKINWKSSDPSLVSVSSDGAVTAKKSGSAIITATAASGGETAKCTINVTAISISLNYSKLTMNLNDSKDLTVKFSPEDTADKSVSYSVDNSNVASVSDTGKITAQSPGTAIVTVKSVAGGTVATCVVTVPTPTYQEVVDSLKDDYEDGYAYDFNTNTELSISPEQTDISQQQPSGDNSTYVVFNGETLNFTLPIINVNGRTFYPMRELLEAIGAEVSWIPATKTAIGKIGDLKVEFTINSGSYSDNGVIKLMDAGVYPFLLDSRTYLPIRYACEALGYEVSWDNSTKTIYIVQA